MIGHTITLPEGTRCRIAMRPPHHFIVAAPPGHEPTLDALLAAPNVVGMFSHDAGVAWPNRDGCRWASEYLATGHAIGFQFETLADALTCHARLLKSGAIMIRPKVKAGRKRVIVAPQPDLRVMRAAKLDRVADLELALGHSVIAERLARMADDIREGAR